MKALQMVGVLLLVLGFLSLIVPLPHRERHGIRVGDAKFSIQTESKESCRPPSESFSLAEVRLP